MPTIITSLESERGCGFRKPGGFYFVMDKDNLGTCGKLPIELCTCSQCGSGISYSRGGKWINPNMLLEGITCKLTHEVCSGCTLEDPSTLGRRVVEKVKGYKKALSKKREMIRLMPGIEDVKITQVEEGVLNEDFHFEVSGYYPHVLLLWVGKNYYNSFSVYWEEAMRMGISRRIKTVPRNFVIGKSVVFLAHTNCIIRGGNMYPGVFFVFTPRVEYVVDKENDTDEKLDKLEKKGITIVDVVHDTTLL
jgi:hypothetical protein